MKKNFILKTCSAYIVQLKQLPKAAYWFYALYAVFFALLSTTFSCLLQFWQPALDFEHYLYDDFQNRLAIDSKDDPTYARFAPYLEQLVFINTDSSFINPETDRLLQPSLGKLLERISLLEAPPPAILLDYAPQKIEDSALLQSLRRLRSQIILPYSVRLQKELSFRWQQATMLASDVHTLTPTDSSFTTGYVFVFSDHKELLRYCKLQTDDGILESAPLLLAQKTAAPASFKSLLQEQQRKMLPINYILRNREMEGKERAVNTYQAADLMQVSAAQLQSMLLNKTLIIGMFEPYYTKYGQRIDHFATPVENQMSGALVLANIWLNITASARIQRGGFWLLLLINLFIGILLSANQIFNALSNSQSKFQTLIKMYVKILVALLAFGSVTWYFFKISYWQLSLGMSLLLYQSEAYLMLTYKVLLEQIAKRTRVDFFIVKNNEDD